MAAWRDIDPFDTFAAAVHLTQRIKLVTGYDIETRPYHMYPMEIDRLARVIRVRPGLPFKAFHWGLAQIGLHLINPEWYPELGRVTRSAEPVNSDGLGCGSHHPRFRCPDCRERA